MTTTDLANFGYRELEMLEELLRAMREQGLPDDFDDCEVSPVMNQYSGNVFLSNSEFQVAMMNGDNLESFYTLSYSGEEGFADELYSRFESDFIDENDFEQLIEIFEANNMDSEADEVRAKLEEDDSEDELVLLNTTGLLHA